jgi:hypothetical protein
LAGVCDSLCGRLPLLHETKQRLLKLIYPAIIALRTVHAARNAKIAQSNIRVFFSFLAEI